MDARSSDLAETLQRLGLSEHAADLAPFATLELGLVPDPDGASWIGGVPELPPELAWPARRWPLAETLGWPDFARAEVDVSRDKGQVWVDGDELVMPLPFLAQLDLPSIAALEDKRPRLPARGMLAVFASVTSDIEDDELAKRVATAILHLPDRDSLVARSHPATYDAPPPRTVRLRAERSIAWNIPWEDRPDLTKVLGDRGVDALFADDKLDRHAVFPCPREEITGPMPPPGELALLRFIEDDDAGFIVGDASWITFVISELDLRAQRFERARGSVFIG